MSWPSSPLWCDEKENKNYTFQESKKVKLTSMLKHQQRLGHHLHCPRAISKPQPTALLPSGCDGRNRGSTMYTSSTTQCAAAQQEPPTHPWFPITPGQNTRLHMWNSMMFAICKPYCTWMAQILIKSLWLSLFKSGLSNYKKDFNKNSNTQINIFRNNV